MVAAKPTVNTLATLDKSKDIKEHADTHKPQRQPPAGGVPTLPSPQHTSVWPRGCIWATSSFHVLLYHPPQWDLYSSICNYLLLYSLWCGNNPLRVTRLTVWFLESEDILCLDGRVNFWFVSGAKPPNRPVIKGSSVWDLVASGLCSAHFRQLLLKHAKRETDWSIVDHRSVPPSSPLRSPVTQRSCTLYIHDYSENQ